MTTQYTPLDTPEAVMAALAGGLPVELLTTSGMRIWESGPDAMPTERWVRKSIELGYQFRTPSRATEPAAAGEFVMVPKSFVAAARNYVRCARAASGLSPYISENGLRGGSPWAELIDEVESINAAPPPPASDLAAEVAATSPAGPSDAAVEAATGALMRASTMLVCADDDSEPFRLADMIAQAQGNETVTEAREVLEQAADEALRAAYAIERATPAPAGPSAEAVLIPQNFRKPGSVWTRENIAGLLCMLTNDVNAQTFQWRAEGLTDSGKEIGDWLVTVQNTSDPAYAIDRSTTAPSVEGQGRDAVFLNSIALTNAAEWALQVSEQPSVPRGIRNAAKGIARNLQRIRENATPAPAGQEDARDAARFRAFMDALLTDAYKLGELTDVQKTMRALLRSPPLPKTIEEVRKRIDAALDSHVVRP